MHTYNTQMRTGSRSHTHKHRMCHTESETQSSSFSLPSTRTRTQIHTHTHTHTRYVCTQAQMFRQKNEQNHDTMYSETFKFLSLSLTHTHTHTHTHTQCVWPSLVESSNTIFFIIPLPPNLEWVKEKGFLEITSLFWHLCSKTYMGPLQSHLTGALL
jgi:hypothetical protein